MCILELKNWYGQTGNNVLCAIFCIYHCKENNIKNIKIASHPIIKLKKNIIVENGCECSKKIYDEVSFYYHYLGKLTMGTMKKISDEFISFDLPSIKIFSDIAIHIRSGDIMTQKPHPYYIQPPLIYYKNIIDKNKDKNIVIVSEDEKNPVIKKIKSFNYNNVSFQTSDIKKDIITLAKCNSLVTSNGTFWLTAFLFSNSIKKVIFPEYLDHWFKCDESWGENIEIEKKYFPNYIERNKWENNSRQRKLMLIYNK